MEDINKDLVSTRFKGYKITFGFALCLAFFSCVINLFKGGNTVGSIFPILIIGTMNAVVWYFDRNNPKIYYNFENSIFYYLHPKMENQISFLAKDVIEFSEQAIRFLKYHPKYKIVFKDEYNQKQTIQFYPNTTINLKLIGVDIQLRNPTAFIKF